MYTIAQCAYVPFLLSRPYPTPAPPPPPSPSSSLSPSRAGGGRRPRAARARPDACVVCDIMGSVMHDNLQ